MTFAIGNCIGNGVMPININVMNKDRFSVIRESKFEKMSTKELQESKGGLCISCKRRDRTVEIGIEADIKVNK